MSKFILLDDDKANFNPTFGLATVIVRPGDLKASGKSTLNGKKVCIDGDEKNVSVPSCVYTTPIHSIPGTGTLKIAALGGDQKAKKTNSGGKPVLLKGSTFTAKFEVQNPAKKPPSAPGEPPTPDPTPQYSGTGTFITTNTKWQGT
ncbi:hypothetical protein IQ231_19100 [Cuspidothrix issatschenkoi LEGE 03284]|uniref:hypothetical protein n=1 Tax=Cuspidothrix issatschenkoi TaxID=230752 RepID=UPI00187FCF7C|nr:hypothetical protein [Cuspidothrix issatschenkoi]MBE9233718.1 hypothetical protein [Cuspidothrix issatschenkoi LEGE 03284]